MSLLLDTHIWLWSLLEPERLSADGLEAIGAPGAQHHLSPVSVWEAMILVEKGRIAVEEEAAPWLREALASSPVVEAPLTFEVAIASGAIDVPHRDLADRFIAATAKVYGLTLATADRRLLRCRDIETLSA